jgi:deoxyribonuclease-4
MGPVFDHMPQLPNLASPKDDVYDRSAATLSLEILRCGQLKIPYLVTHLGSHLGDGKEVGIKRIFDAINIAFSNADNGGVSLA